MNSQVKKDAETMRNAMKGIGTDEKALIEIAAKRTHKDRMKIRHEYKSMFGRDLLSDLESELFGDFKKCNACIIH